MKFFLILSLISFNANALDEIRVFSQLDSCKPERVLLSIGKNTGIFKKHGLTILETDKEKNNDLYLSGRKEIYRLFADDKNSFKAIIASFMDDSHTQYAIVTRKDSKITKISDLKMSNLYLESHSGGARQNLVKDILKVTESGKNFNEVHVDQNFKLKKNQAIYIREPRLSVLMAKNPDYKILIDEPILKTFFNPWPMAYYVASKKFIDSKPIQFQKVMNSFSEILQSYNRNPEIAKVELSKCLSKNYNVSKSNIRLINFWNFNEFNLDIIQRQVDLYYHYKLMKEPFRASELVYKPTNASFANN